MQTPRWLVEVPGNGWYSQLRGDWLFEDAYLLAGLWVPLKQRTASEWAVEMFHRRRFGILYARPGFGKTNIIEQLSHRFAADGHRVLVIGPASATEQNTKIRGIKIDEVFKYKDGQIVWSTFGRYGKHITTFKPDVVLIDEISRFKIDLAMVKPLRLIPYHLYATIGFTGTVIENDLEEFFKVIAVVAPFFEWQRRKLAYRLLRRFVVRVHSIDATVRIVEV